MPHSQTDTTQPPQWAIDAADKLVRLTGWSTGDDRDAIDVFATIIARHAPNAIIPTELGYEIAKGVNRITELEAREARLRDALRGINYGGFTSVADVWRYAQAVLAE